MQKMTAKQTLRRMAELLEEYLEELKDVRDTGESEFAYGEKTAYVECLEVIQLWKGAKDLGLDYNVEERYPL